METPPDTFSYMILGYVVFTIVILVYLVSLYKRWRNLERELHVLDEIAKP